jgi:hypothetical protein
MSYLDLLRLYFDRSNALQNYWTLYVVVIGGLLAFSTLRQRPDTLKSVLVTLLYVGFAHKNLAAIGDATAERAAILHAMSVPPVDAMQFHAEMQAALDPTPYAAARDFHVACDVLTLAAVWGMELRRRRKRPGTA